jgi:intraflagellar transport protein 122
MWSHFRYIELLNRIEHGRRHGKDENLFMAEILAYQQKYQEAAKMYARSNKVCAQPTLAL